MLKWIVPIVCIVQLLQANVMDHLKPARNKEGIYSIPNIDFIYVINLDKRPEKFSQTADQLAPYGIFPYRFSAVNGWELSIEEIADVGIKFRKGMNPVMATRYLHNGSFNSCHEETQANGHAYFCHCMSRGAIAIVLSHLSVLKDAYDAGYETIWVMEDDIEVVDDPRILSERVKDLDSLVTPNGWDVLFTDRDTKDRFGRYVPCRAHAQRPNFTPPRQFNSSLDMEFSPQFRRIGSRYGAYSMIVRRSGMKKILDFYKKHHIFLPYDMDFFFAKDLRVYTVLQDVVSTLTQALSDNGGPNYERE